MFLNLLRGNLCNCIAPNGAIVFIIGILLQTFRSSGAVLKIK